MFEEFLFKEEDGCKDAIDNIDGGKYVANNIARAEEGDDIVVGGNDGDDGGKARMCGSGGCNSV